MTASRAFDELVAADPSIVGTEGRRRVLRPGRDKMALWRRLEPRMSSPVTREHCLARIPAEELPPGGISALCELSMLQDNPWPTYAATKAQERARAGDRHARDRRRRACSVVQVLRYKPVPALGCAVDPPSAILSLPDEERDDPRVAGEIENVLPSAWMRLRPQRGDGEDVDVVLGVVAAEGRGGCNDGGELWLRVSGRRVGRDLLA